MTRHCDWERRQRVVVDGRTVAEIRTECPHPAKARKLIEETAWDVLFGDEPSECVTYEHCTACGQDVRRVPSGRDHQPVRCGGTEET